MADTFTKTERSRIMRSVKSEKNRSTELKLIEIFRICKITGWRRNSKLLGKPDFTFPKLKMVLFADGCFWHGHKCRNTAPKTNSKYWTAKIIRNKTRDRNVNRALEKVGWRVIRIWECQINVSRIIRLFNGYHF